MVALTYKTNHHTPKEQSAMYNEELKQRFINSFTKNSHRITNLIAMFNAIEPFERAWGADICTKSDEEVKPAVEKVTGLRTTTKIGRMILLKEYAKWCMKEGIEGACDGLLKIGTEGFDSIGLENVRLQTVANPLHLQRYLDTVFDKEEKKTVDNVYRCFLWLAYMGISEDDIIGLKCRDVNLDRMIVDCGGVRAPIYREALDAFQNCVRLDHFVYYHPNYPDKPQYKAREPREFLLCGNKGLPSFKSITTVCARKRFDPSGKLRTEMHINFSRAQLSGIFFRMSERERAGDIIDFLDIADWFIDDKVYKLDRGTNTQETKRRQIARLYEEDYLRWKLVHKY